MLKTLVISSLVAMSIALSGCQSTSSESTSSSASVPSAPSALALNGKAIFLTANTKLERTDFYSQTDRGSVSERQSNTYARAVLIRQNGDNLLVADPDNQAGTVFVNGKSVKSSGSIAGKGKTVCVDLLIEEGYKRNICSRYTYRNGVLEISEVEKDPAEKRTTNRKYKLSYDGNSCKLISFTSSSNARDAYCDGLCLSAYGGSTKWRYEVKQSATSGKCSIR